MISVLTADYPDVVSPDSEPGKFKKAPTALLIGLCGVEEARGSEVRARRRLRALSSYAIALYIPENALHSELQQM